ncbi:amino acid ABC transporter permease [Roseomonas sp. OT10]|uniref:amino acid ABC transporter permease n=1 Tax=Roseomonas cutis TaxID=2897332 RepID=UPI001E485534|nr:amino acid ABC transporter permease [Roseomonas sp. OT10]UFN48501.1 amino acid ABC transporter permease [Roseomonas sp. OT10]
MTQLIDTFFNLPIILQSLPLLLQGLWLTVALTLVALPVSALAGLLLACLGEAPSRTARLLSRAHVDVFRAMPPLVLLVFLFYALPLVGLGLPQFLAATLSMVLNGSAYFAEVFRAGLEAVPRGQREAARSLGMSWTVATLLVVVPPAVRHVLPDLLGNAIELFKLTAIASAVSMQDLLRSAQISQGLTFNPSPLTAAALIYVAIAWPLVRWMSNAQRRDLPPHVR